MVLSFLPHLIKFERKTMPKLIADIAQEPEPAPEPQFLDLEQVTKIIVGVEQQIRQREPYKYFFDGVDKFHEVMQDVSPSFFDIHRFLIKIRDYFTDIPPPTAAGEYEKGIEVERDVKKYYESQLSMKLQEHDEIAHQIRKGDANPFFIRAELQFLKEHFKVKEEEEIVETRPPPPSPPPSPKPKPPPDLEDPYDFPTSRFGENFYDTYGDRSKPDCQNVANLEDLPIEVCIREQKNNKKVSNLYMFLVENAATTSLQSILHPRGIRFCYGWPS